MHVLRELVIDVFLAGQLVALPLEDQTWDQAISPDKRLEAVCQANTMPAFNQL